MQLPAKLDAAVIDSSALISILMGEPAGVLFVRAFQMTGSLYIGTATRAETWLAAFNAKGLAGAQLVEELLVSLQVQTVDFTHSSLQYFVYGGERYHHKVNAKSKLNLGDLYTYSTVQEMGLPLFYQGADFLNTPIQSAMKLLGYGVSEKGEPVVMN